MKKELLRYASVAQFMKDALGERFRISLIDSDDLRFEVDVTENGLSEKSETTPADKALLSEILDGKELKGQDYLCSFSSAGDDMAEEKKSVFYIRNELGEICGFLCIHERRGDLYMVREVLDQLLLPDGQTAGGSERIEEEVNALLKERIVEIWKKHTAMSKTMRKPEKIAFVSELFEMGIFRMKGAVAQVSEVTGISQASLYRYFSEVIED